MYASLLDNIVSLVLVTFMLVSVYLFPLKGEVQLPYMVTTGGSGTEIIDIYWSDELKALMGPQFAFPSSNMLIDTVDSR